MNSRNKSLIYAAIVGLIIVAIFLGFLSSITNPISWLLIVVLALTPVLYEKVNKTNEIQWKEEYSVGIESLDNDHKKLISLLNHFTTAYDYAMSEEFEREALNDLINYTKYHFDREEKLLEQHDYPNLVAHKAQHKQMIKQVERFMDLYNEKGHEALNEISEFLANWLINHINGTDKEYSELLSQRGAK
ncbi:bacteriohemerythrin [Colwellia sp. M166]|uniref:bacteriohemerythrin n=1 Tax=Colwellia sp. M166 TaxID=2583805 RepID=UPI00211DADBB|nr:bacteriohemerythrin [Colwellia sp. M166]UUO25127.1 bacteriohemerythrin [Colwellia sp. M166]|tara:strand:- start:817 stop:1383 length:567 start_codon:yes stop_codon:yes gene_type:complete